MHVRKSVAIALAISGNAAAATSALAGDWSGPYAGISAGGGWGYQSQHTSILQPPGGGTSTGSTTGPTTGPITTPGADGQYNLSGALVGGGVGYNWQISNFVFGLEGDGSWADISGSDQTCGSPVHPCGGGIDAFGTVRGRVGIDPGISLFNGVLLYATGGLAVADVHAWDSLNTTSGSHVDAGWTVGGGIETKITPNWSVKLEYLYAQFDDPGLFSALPPNPERVRTDVNIVRVGVNYYFNAPPPPAPPVIAKY
jgi:outer membrane immunogenic protein